MEELSTSETPGRLPDGLSLAYFWGAIRRNALLVLGSAILFAGLAAALVLSGGTEYECTATLWVHRNRSLLSTSTLQAPEPSQQMLVAFMMSRSLRLEVAKKLNLMDNKTFWGKSADEPHTETDMLERLDDMIEVYEVRSKPTIELTVKAGEAELAYKLCSELIERSLETTDAMKKSESDFLSHRLKMRKTRFNKAVQDLVEFQRENGLVADISSQGQAFFEASLKLREGLIKTESELAGVDRMLEAPANVPEQLQLIARKDGLDGAVSFLRSQSDEASDRLSEFPELTGKYTMLQAEVLIEQELLKATTLSAEEAQLQAEQENPKLIIVDAPRVPEEPINELPAKVIVGWLFGWVVGLGLASIREVIRGMRKS